MGTQLLELVQKSIDIFFTFCADTWWFWLFFGIFFAARGMWLWWRIGLHYETLNWKFVELKIPREIEKSPRAMDQVLQAFAQLQRATAPLKKKYILGTLNPWISLEMVSFGGDVHFYVRAVDHQIPIVKATFFAYYPDVEVVDVSDYTDQLPQNATDMKILKQEIRISDIVLTKSPIFQPRTYKDFETPDEAQQFDPISIFMETLGSCDSDQFIGVQYNLSHISYDWGKDKKYQKEIEALRETKFSDNAQPMADGTMYNPMLMRSPRQTDILKKAEETIGQAAFDVGIRVMSITPKAKYNDEFAARKVERMFNQYASADLNSFINAYESTTGLSPHRSPTFLIRERRHIRKTYQLQAYISRDTGTSFIAALFQSHPLFWPLGVPQTSILTTETIATLFHPPTNLVLTAPHTQRVESRKVGAPAGLPIYSDEAELGRFN